MAAFSNPRARRYADRPTRSYAVGNFFRRLLALVILAILGWCGWVVVQIRQVASDDQAQTADAIAVFGAAEYSGRPSPVYHARLDHAIELYRKDLAPLIITLGGGSDRDSGKTEGGVGRDYLLANGVPLADIIAETHSFNTSQQAQRLAAIAQEHGLQHILVVSDATHLFRIRELCRQNGLDVYTSPRPTVGHISTEAVIRRYFHEVLSYTAFRLGMDQGRLQRFVDGRGDDQND